MVLRHNWNESLNSQLSPKLEAGLLFDLGHFRFVFYLRERLQFERGFYFQITYQNSQNDSNTQILSWPVDGRQLLLLLLAAHLGHGQGEEVSTARFPLFYRGELKLAEQFFNFLNLTLQLLQLLGDTQITFLRYVKGHGQGLAKGTSERKHWMKSRKTFQAENQL